MTAVDVSPIVRSTIVRCPAEVAFEFYTARFSSWWPLKTHSVGEESTTAAVMEAGVGGRIYEISDGREIMWGEVVAWDPPRRLVHSWYPGRTPTESTEVEISFEPHGEGTQITLEHRGWHKLGADGVRRRDNYTGDNAWAGMLLLFKGLVEQSIEGDGR